MDPEMIAVLRAKSPAERLQIADQMWHFAARMVRAQVEQERQGETDAAIEKETARRLANGSW